MNAERLILFFDWPEVHLPRDWQADFAVVISCNGVRDEVDPPHQFVASPTLSSIVRQLDCVVIGNVFREELPFTVPPQPATFSAEHSLETLSQKNSEQVRNATYPC